jgi:hypothetical protein
VASTELHVQRHPERFLSVISVFFILQDSLLRLLTAIFPGNRFLPAYHRHGPDTSLVHFIGASKPWHQLNRSRGRSQDDPSVYSGLLDRWYDVYERHFGHTATAAVGRPSQGAQKQADFVTSHVTPVWDTVYRNEDDRAYRPPSPDKLAEMFGGPIWSGDGTRGALAVPPPPPQEGEEGAYVHLGMEGRPSAPAPSTAPVPSDGPISEPRPEQLGEAAIPQPPAPPTAAPGPPEQAAPPPVERAGPEAQQKQPDQARAEEGPQQAPVQLGAHYANVWDEPSSRETRAFFEPPSSYAPVPAFTESRYADTMRPPPESGGGAAGQQREQPKPVFPWEEPRHAAAQAQAPPSRIFPGDRRVEEERARGPEPPHAGTAATTAALAAGVAQAGGRLTKSTKPRKVPPRPIGGAGAFLPLNVPAAEEKGDVEDEEREIKRQGLDSLGRFVALMELRGKQARRDGVGLA